MSIAADIVTSLGAWLKAQAQNALIVTAMYVLGFAVLGVPWWLLTGLIAGALNLVPHLGPLLALGLALFVKWASTDDWIPLLWICGVWLAIQTIEGFILSPRAAGRAGVNPFYAILLTIAGGILFGPPGMLLAVPLTAVTLVVVRAVRRTGD